jgi:hypothetical protein
MLDAPFLIIGGDLEKLRFFLFLLISSKILFLDERLANNKDYRYNSCFNFFGCQNQSYLISIQRSDCRPVSDLLLRVLCLYDK